MAIRTDPADLALLDRWQRGFPLVPRPFAEIAAAHGLAESEVLARLSRLRDAGAIGRFGGTLRPNAAGASTLAAIAAPPGDIEAVAGAVGREPGVNHSYLREGAVNVWFVATGPDRAHVSATLARIAARTGLDVLDLPLMRAFNIDLGFPLAGPAPMPPPGPDGAAGTPAVLAAADRALMQALADGLAISARPYAALGGRLGLSEAETIRRIRRLVAARLVSRFGLILRHRALGWTANAMVVWPLPEDAADRVGPVLARQPGITLCYRRRPVPGRWPHTLYAMVHARARAEARGTLERAAQAAGIAETPRAVLFSLRCFKQRGALVAAPRTEPAA